MHENIYLHHILMRKRLTGGNVSNFLDEMNGQSMYNAVIVMGKNTRIVALSLQLLSVKIFLQSENIINVFFL